VPTYQYACTDCGHRFEQVQAFSDASLTDCPVCGGKLRKVYGSVGVVFKGSGFYRTDSRSGAAANGDKSDAGSATSADSGKAAAKESGTTATKSSDSAAPSTNGSSSSGASTKASSNRSSAKPAAAAKSST
jgi:putative FmdB family regulatory protein